MTLTPGMGGGDFEPQQSFKIITNHNKTVRTKIVHTSGTFVEQMFKNIFKISPYIQKTITNPINALKIAIYNIKHTTNTKIYCKTSKMIETYRKTYWEISRNNVGESGNIGLSVQNRSLTNLRPIHLPTEETQDPTPPYTIN